MEERQEPYSTVCRGADFSLGYGMEAVSEWHEIDGRSGYKVNGDGQIWSDRAGRVLIGSRAGRGYRFIQFPDGKREYVHTLVCTAFHGPRPTGCQVRHLDGDLDNNAESNLTWGTKLENEADRKIHGTTAKGIRNPQAKLNPRAVSEMRRMRSETTLSFKSIATRFGVTAMTAHRAITGASWND